MSGEKTMGSKENPEGKGRTRTESKLRQERLRQKAMYWMEEEVMGLGYQAVAGLDEAGRGPLAGPVVAAAVILCPQVFIPGINDSKKLSPERRTRIYQEIVESGLPYAVGEAGVEEIDRLNILQASRLAMLRAVENLPRKADYLLIDGYAWPGISLPHRGVIKGDTKSLSIAAASIVAKVTRDRMMEELDQAYPEYGFAKHKGYATAEHIKAISLYGLSPVHRKSFHLRSKQQPLDLEA